MRRFAGVDGCRGGWVVAHLENASVHFEVVTDFAAVLEAVKDAHIVAVDMPIGLPERVGPGGRGPDALLRPQLGARQSSVFSVPARAAVMCTDYRAACAAALAHSDPPRKVSKQCFHIFPKIREVDAAMTPELQARVVEAHPEGAFWALNGETPLPLPKRVKSQPFAAGLALRRALLERAGLTLAPFPAGAGADDFLDAAACASTAQRIAEGRARRFPETPAIDCTGLRVEIWA